MADAEEGRTDAAIAGFESLTRDYPELPEPWNNLARAVPSRGDYDAARIALQTAVVAAPDWAVAHENLGDLYAALARRPVRARRGAGPQERFRRGEAQARPRTAGAACRRPPAAATLPRRRTAAAPAAAATAAPATRASHA